MEDRPENLGNNRPSTFAPMHIDFTDLLIFLFTIAVFGFCMLLSMAHAAEYQGHLIMPLYHLSGD